MSADAVSEQLDLLARLLEENGYAVEVNYAGATITVWTDEWPIQLRVSPKERVAAAADDEGEGVG
ncbi:MAG TPA: hypothetical protein VFA21_13715 [Pyrinomonadaceae bacterium]|nr:hypothetical protein [Pyrinomonadaceae bacterium]